MIETDVLIIGGGIAGPALAAALSQHDIRVVLLERSDKPLDTARGDHLQPRSVQTLSRWGVLEDIQACGAQRREGTVWLDHQGEVLLEAMVAPLDLPCPYFLFLNHEHISACLLRAAQCSSRFTLLKPVSRWTVQARGQRSVRVRVVREDDAALDVVSRVLIGADGQNSQVMKLTNIEAHTQRYARPINVLFAREAKPLAGNCLRAYLGPSGILAQVPRTGGMCKLGAGSSTEQTREWRAGSPQQWLEQLASLAPPLAISELRYSGVYPPTRRIAERWVDGNIALIGDACHAMHPAQSQGMNVAIRCVDALASALTEGANLNDALERWQAQTKPGIDAVLEDNHKAGLMFDTTDSTQLAHFAGLLRSIQVEPDAQRAYAMRSAGY